MSRESNNLDLPITTIHHSQTIHNKLFLKKIYCDFYKEFKSLLPKKIKGKIVELGSGGGFIKDFIPTAITSDIMKLPMCDKQFSVEKMPFANNSVAAFIMLNTFHHFKNAESALTEMSRCLKKDGKIIMIEPYNSIWSKFIYQNFHHEIFNPYSNWKIKGKGPLSHANGALPWIIFSRDIVKFKSRYPELKLIKLQPHTSFSYLLSGGLSKPQLAPTFTFHLIKNIEKLLTPFMKYIGMFVTIEIVKVNN